MKFKKLLIFYSIVVVFSINSYAQTINIKGKITDEKLLPLPGVSITIKGTTNSTSSDFDGNYDIQSDAKAILIFSFIGFTTIEEAVNDRNTVDIKMLPQLEDLEEVVVVGYGTQKKSVVTGSISSVRAKDIENLPITRIEQTLQGRVSGVVIAANSGQPGSSSTIRVRGITSFNSNEPLWVVDGVVVDAGGIGFLNQSDIESVEVLKDAASAAIYGTRAAAGVILVTTKKGKSGKLNVTYNGFFGSSSPARKLNLLNAEQYATLSNEASVAGGGAIKYADPAALGQGTDWQSAIFNDNAKREGHEISLSGGNEKSTFYVSFGLIQQEGIVATAISNYVRKNIRLNSTHKVSTWLTFGQTLGYSNEKNRGIGNTNSEFGGPLASAINLDPITPIIETNSALSGISPYDNNGVVRDAFGNPYGISSVVSQEIVNPLAYVQNQLGNYGWADNFVGNAYAEITPISGLKIRSTIAGKLAYYGGQSFTPVSYLNASTFNLRNNISKNTNRNFGWNIENTASYTKQIQAHNFTVLLGQGTYVDRITRGSGVTYFDIPVTSYEDASFNFSIPQDQIDAFAYEGARHVITSLFSRLNYDYKEKYLFTGIIRRDGSSRFGDNNKYGIFPSLSAGWVVSKENFWKNNKIINQLKIRGGYGKVGSDEIGDFQYLSTVSGGRNFSLGNVGDVLIGTSPNAPSNPNLKWEETTQSNIAIEATLFNNFNFSLDFYNKKTTGILRNYFLPGFVGATGSPAGNVADMENRGFDLEVNYRKKIGELNFSLTGILSHLKNEVTNTGNEQFINGPTVQSTNYNTISRTEVGHPFFSFFGLKTQGIFQNQAEIDSYTNSTGIVIQPGARPGDFRWKDLDDNGVIDAEDRTYIGNPIPDFTFGLTLNLDYKNFDLLVFTQGSAGNQIYQGLRRLDIANANYQTNALGRWTGEGTSNSYPRLTTNDTNNNFNNPSDFYIEDGDYFRFKTIQFGYSLPEELINRVGLQKTRIYLTGENLITFTKYSGFDPEIGGGVLGIDRGFYPQAQSVMLGVNLQF